jgi:hypothetical protein
MWFLRIGFQGIGMVAKDWDFFKRLDRVTVSYRMDAGIFLDRFFIGFGQFGFSDNKISVSCALVTYTGYIY